jgi:hypothetical protein
LLVEAFPLPSRASLEVEKWRHTDESIRCEKGFEKERSVVIDSCAVFGSRPRLKGSLEVGGAEKCALLLALLQSSLAFAR